VAGMPTSPRSPTPSELPYQEPNGRSTRDRYEEASRYRPANPLGDTNVVGAAQALTFEIQGLALAA
jgi:hypothetical protein